VLVLFRDKGEICVLLHTTKIELMNPHIGT